ncbi:Tol-Pal system protein TolB [Azospirillum brasilense]|uniref:Tol-Pal system protein TolB n=2 Tax=Azospirillum TaxID=191 RepID=A0A0P0F4J8_AZOBR|nr:MULTISPECIES: Tol-Pal system beta propeller repeat protein TolB [Azospirillum]ALJ35592.1 translocation protein TolB [Azospirillum brasilense]MBK4719890.1 Tol-Pal system protein TolB [Azospirillum aestuarii]MDW7555535.1 Tol-Pal system beta propeller repeat protein TolB [Azospirillum brasilense]MDW7595462.1 Tol-Pal system beta propeller repeat protein TolB [Azospirillum brasilense]MDW7630467.1 Tol-Pal system beta propeller repeat protein TolB [Azospirillum brasilense]
MTKKTRLLLKAAGCAGALLLALGVAAPAPARAEVRIDITKGVVEPLPIAITSFAGAGGREAQVGSDISKVVAADLERSGLFRPLDPKGFLQTPDQLRSGEPRYQDWRAVGAQALVAGNTTAMGDGRMKVDFRLWDVAAGQYMQGLSYTATADSWRRIAHIVADAIYKRLTGEEGYFDTRIVYVAESGPANARKKQLAIMDQDGENHQFLTDGKNLVLTPRFSPATQEITYMSYFNKKPRVYLFNIDSGRQEVLGDFVGMTFAPRFSPDGNKVVMSMAQNGNTDIYALDLRTRRQTQLTDSPGIDTGPSYSPDGQRIVFESDRGGSQQLYIMGADGSGQKRLTFGEGRYGTPVWSPRGDLIAFTRQRGSNFALGVIRPDGTGERILTESFHVEGPTWAPNGRVLSFFRDVPAGDGRGRSAKLYTIDVTGANERRVITPLDGSDPAWSPLIP